VSDRRRRARCAAAAALVLLAGAVHAAETKRTPAAPPSEPRMHVVERGDTLSGIAARYGVTVNALVEANHLDNERVVLRVGWRLTVPAPTAQRSDKTAGSTPADKPRPRRDVPVREARGCCRPRPCCGPRNLMLFVPEFVDIAPVFTWPVDGPVTSTFGRRRSGWHRGIDIKAPRGAAIFAAAPGVVVISDREPRYGRVVKIEHDGGFLTVYAHNEENLVDVGTLVAGGDPIATIGRTGRATAHHLHFEIRRDGSVYNPLYLLPLPPRIGQIEESDETEEEHD
jgi:murein DD-endopeptidase MepM/ murein hydrolase activator NlpD